MYQVHTDGSCLGNPGAGGWAALANDFKLCGAQRDTTNNQMEMTAVIKALERCLQINERRVTINTDSNYTKNGITSWIEGWKRNGWRTAKGTEVKNKELWMRLDALREKFVVLEWKWVKAHNGNPANEQVDKLARECAKNLSNQ